MTDISVAGAPSKITRRAESKDSEWETNRLELHQVTEFHKDAKTAPETHSMLGKEEETEIMRGKK